MKIYHQSVFDKWQIDDNSIQAIITSPPYWSLRKYDIPDVAIGEWQGQYGLEPTYQMYVEHTLLWAEEVWRVLRDDGIFFLNLGDSYNSGVIGRNDADRLGGLPYSEKRKKDNYPSKCQLLIPHRIIIALIDNGWILRNTIIWHKPNGMPESVTDRFSKKYEYIFFFCKNQKYFFDLDAVREEHKQISIERLNRAISNNNKWIKGADGQTPHNLSQPRPNRNTKINKEESEMFGSPRARYHRENNYKERIGSMQSTKFEDGDYLVANLHPLGKNPGDVWSIPTQPSSEKHFAMWPEKLVERMILCSTKAGDTVLDPFAGSGTTLRVADRLNREAIGIDLGYADVQSRRLSEIQKVLV